jgi:predicted nucleic acid-binding protein
MVLVDTSAWVEYFRDGDPAVVAKVDRCLDEELVCVGDLIYCEIMQGIRSGKQRREVGSLLMALPRFEMVGFHVAERAAANYRLLRSRGVSVRKTIDVIIATFCAENDHRILHCDKDFDQMAPHIGLARI